MRIVIATGNPHKVEEMARIFADPALGLAPLALEFVGLTDLPGSPFPEPNETGATFEQNATIKALAYAQATESLCLADDSGLEIDALDGRPGVISSHYCTNGEERGMARPERDQRNIERVLAEMTGIPAHARAARFVCVMALASPGETLIRVRGTFEGRIGFPADTGPHVDRRDPNNADVTGAFGAPVPRGSNGFGYDPIFLLPAPDTRTSAELSPADKDARSHRGAAAKLMAARMKQLLERRE
ncbi:MAG: non-canonical purine NTP pyrophosphatase [Phycisphaeraceae bacterium]|nr:non-canonical purine NTP pyrophosphatase [Phycisphaeraceae bacterium]